MNATIEPYQTPYLLLERIQKGKPLKGDPFSVLEQAKALPWAKPYRTWTFRLHNTPEESQLKAFMERFESVLSIHRSGGKYVAAWWKEDPESPFDTQFIGIFVDTNPETGNRFFVRANDGPRLAAFYGGLFTMLKPKSKQKRGEFNSSKTRVAPVFAELMKKKENWLNPLIQLLNIPHAGFTLPDLSNETIEEIHFDCPKINIEDKRINNNEKALEAPKSLLEELVQHFPEENKIPQKNTETNNNRRLLKKGDENTIKLAVEMLENSSRGKHWWILEGPTKPDVYIETKNFIIVIEGKRTEAGPTTKTTWMPGRHQMLRHIDAAWDNPGSKTVLGFFIVEGKPNTCELPNKWLKASSETISQKAIQSSLPHRDDKEKQAIANAFVGVTTWKKVCNAFGIQWDNIEKLIA